MKFGIIAITWQRPFLTEHLSLLEKIRTLGFRLVEFAVEDERHLDYGKTARVLRETGLTCCICTMLNPQRDLAGDDPAARAGGKAYLKHCIDAVAEMGGRLVDGPVIGDPLYFAGRKATVRDTAEKARKRALVVEGLREIGAYAAAKGVTVAVEPLNRFETALLTTAAQAKDLIREVGSPAVRIHLDTFHMNVEEDSFGGAIRTAGADLAQFHANENHRGNPGEGHVPWGEVAAALREISYDGPVVMEPFRRPPVDFGTAAAHWHPPTPDEDGRIARGLATLKDHFRQAGYEV